MKTGNSNIVVEEWRDLCVNGKLIKVSSLGNIRNKRNKPMHLSASKWGYYKINLRVNQEMFTTPYVHKLVAIAFLPNPENKPTVNHIDGNKLNNHVTNLEWATKREQSTHAVNTGLMPLQIGENAANRKLSKNSVKYIRLLITKKVKHSEIKQRVLEKHKIDISLANISAIANKRSWDHKKANKLIQ